MQLTKEAYFSALMERHGAENQRRLSNASVGIAGLGGLGSHIAFALARLGIGELVLADFDAVDVSNLNRQQYRISDLGRPKAEALAEQLKQVNPFCRYQVHVLRITPDNAADLFQNCTVICEAFDWADQKAMLIETLRLTLPQIPLVGASGMAGTGSANTIRTERRLGAFYLCGDGVADIADGLSLTAPRVMVCAAHQATMAMRLILGETAP